MNAKLPKKRIIKADAAAWKRIVSFIIDFFIIQLIIIGPFAPALESLVPTSPDVMANYEYLMQNQNLINEISTIMFIMFMLIYAYFVIFDYKLRQTPGRKIMNIKLDHTEKKKEITLWQILLRNVAAIPIIPFTLLWIIDPIYLIISQKRLVDQFSKTKVIEEVQI